ncbi:MAG: anaerobic ribonucleoside-triphosphate reductase activating protein [Blautia sp.]|nr:anaerobic ribonucleoside-triphosphate reductase activating protein [Blautia sp.]
MKIHGFQKTTLLDYPGHIAATVFTGGCNFRCPFCQNGSLALEPEGQPLIPEEEVLAHLRKRQEVLEGVCITGGEPTLESGLREFILKCRALGYLVKLDTNGYRPEMLREFLQEGILDYVAMDIKASPANYGRAAGIPGCDMDRIRESVSLLRASGVPHEFRTTVVKGIHTAGEFEEIGKWLAGSSVYYLQAYRDSGDILGMRRDRSGMAKDARETAEHLSETDGSMAQPEQDTIGGIMAAFTKEEMEQMAALAGKYIDKVMLRGVG